MMINIWKTYETVKNLTWETVTQFNVNNNIILTALPMKAAMFVERAISLGIVVVAV